MALPSCLGEGSLVELSADGGERLLVHRSDPRGDTADLVAQNLGPGKELGRLLRSPPGGQESGEDAKVLHDPTRSVVVTVDAQGLLQHPERILDSAVIE